jgi:hypothetical protein
MNLQDTLIATSAGALLGWLLKTTSDKLAGWHAERKLINRSIYHLYLLIAHVDHLLDNYSIWNVIDDPEDSERRVRAWGSFFSTANEVQASIDIRSTAVSLSELNPQLSFVLVQLVNTLDGVFGFAATLHKGSDLRDGPERVQQLLKGLRLGLQGDLNNLLAMRRFVRRRLSEKMLRATALRDDRIETIALGVKRRQTPKV